MTDIDEVKAELTRNLKRQEEIRNVTGPLMDEIYKLCERERHLKEIYDHYRAQNETWDWPKLIDNYIKNRGNTSSALYRLMGNKLAEEYHMFYSGMWSDTGEPVFKIQIDHTVPDSLAKNMAGVKYFSSIMAPHEDNMVWFGIFEDSLSAHGIYQLHVRPDLTSCDLTVTRYGRTKSLKKFDNVEDAMDYINKHHYYKSINERCEDEEDY